MRLVRILVVLLALVFVNGCSRQEDEITTIRYMAWGNPEQLAVEQQLIDEFEKTHPNIRVKLFMVPSSSYHQKLQIMLASRTAPDVMRVDHYYFPAMVRKGYFRCLEPFIERDKAFDLSDFFPQALEEGMYRGKLYGMNVLFGPIIIYYNKTMFDRAGIPDPYELDRRGEWTYSKFLEVCIKLTKKDSSGRYVQFGTIMPPDWSTVWAFGGEFVSPDFRRCTLDTPEAIRGLQFLKDLRWKYHVTPTPAEAAMSAFTFESGRVAMILTWSGQSPIYRKNITDFEWDIAPMPVGPAGRFTPLKGNQLVIYSESKHPEEAWEFVKFMVSPETEMLVYGKLRRAIPTRKSVARDPEYLKADLPPRHVHVFIDAMKYGRRIPINERYNQWLPELRAGEELLLTNELDAREAVRWMVPRINRALSEAEW